MGTLSTVAIVVGVLLLSAIVVMIVLPRGSFLGDKDSRSRKEAPLPGGVVSMDVNAAETKVGGWCVSSNSPLPLGAHQSSPARALCSAERRRACSRASEVGVSHSTSRIRNLVHAEDPRRAVPLHEEADD